MVSGFGSVKGFRDAQLELSAARIAQTQGIDVRMARPMAEDAEKMIDDAVVGVGLDRLSVVSRILSRGLVKPLPNWLSVMSLQWDKSARYGSAIQTMTPHTVLESSMPALTEDSIPIYLTVEGGEIGIRTLLASQRAGTPMDTTNIEQWTRNVQESIEDQAINGSTLTISGSNAPGLLNAPNVNTFNYVDNEAWTAAGHSGADILTDVQSGVTQLTNDNFYGPYELFVPTTYGVKLQEDYKAEDSLTIQQRLEQLNYGGQNLVVTVADLLPTNTTVLVQMTSNVLDVVLGQQPTAIQWTVDPGWVIKIAIVACAILRVKDTSASTSGIAVGTPS
jgi:uncharacterized linocin/CFP29 family protein